MKASFEISLYPLDQAYKEKIIEFIYRLREEDDVEVVTNGMSTQLFGDFVVIMDLLKRELQWVFEHQKAVLVMKVAKGNLTTEELPEALK